MAHTDIDAALLHDCGFGRALYARARHARSIAEDASKANGAPVGIWARDGWLTVCDSAPDMLPIDPTTLGWSLVEVVCAA